MMRRSRRLSENIGFSAAVSDLALMISLPSENPGRPKIAGTGTIRPLSLMTPGAVSPGKISPVLYSPG